MKAEFFLVMGVAGSGKTTVGRALAERLAWDFYDADDFHPAENINKMATGTPLDDHDRAPWLAALHALISACLEQHKPGVLACSALKESYRQTLLAGTQGVQLVYLKGDYELIWGRMAGRAGHYMKPHMLKSQYAALEEPTYGLVVDAAVPVDEAVELILKGAALNSSSIHQA